MSRLRVNYAELDSAARTYGAEAEEMQACLTLLQQRAAQLSAAWEGVAEDEFVVQLSSCTTRMKRTPELLRKLASDVRKASEVLEAGERAAQAAIRSIVSADD
jgi:WXG100 family type VII secretion target